MTELFTSSKSRPRWSGSPLSADGLAAALSWTRHRTDAALDHARTHPDTGGALALQHVPPKAYTVAPRLDVLAPHQVDALSGRKNPRPGIRGPIQPAEAEVLLRVWVDGGIDTGDAAQRQALADLAAADMVTRGGSSTASTTTWRTACGCSPSRQPLLTWTLRSHCHNSAHPADIHPAHDTSHHGGRLAATLPPGLTGPATPAAAVRQSAPSPAAAAPGPAARPGAHRLSA
ncbi:hypothetical protein OOK13_43625 [Streptomyces sp. NBC_00378]|uniref:hypothetical protein n=1 Tax=unclassified Streptomyces TaxID=2593676 RepID=UPI00225AF1FB|nr:MULTISPECIES: hypothetical protein [unclassified Streptomyces]MCX5115220.1 hypothetical protein [Streptomyces sp. NBC_00378]